MNLAATLAQSAHKWPGKTALVFEGRRWTYAQWNRWINKAAHAFLAAVDPEGVRRRGPR
jgi:acyl-CoA synthetase (AMP-forming)/AMP-acid ligase II